MPSSDYTAATSGALKLKGAGVDKKKKKKKSKAAGSQPSSAAEKSNQHFQSILADEDGQLAHDSKTPQSNLESPSRELNASDSALTKTQQESVALHYRGKTEAERRYEERRRQRLDDRLKREGIKTHKERVEELNRYLSGLSEHHDMPRIGPG